ncbi:hypothetical protein [Lacrimispora indolis]|uniref:hypothetical protein n=1 Tax=Lacrimispora indolis TaxID=69825 RepID=UPI00045E5FFF|nr:hypothetical protein [Lacrimispora indolis]
MSRDVWGTYVSPDDYINAAKSGICRQTVNSRIAMGWKAKDAISAPVMATSEEYKIYKQLAEKNGIGANTYKRRTQRGWTLEAAAVTPLVSRAESIERTRKTRQRVIPKDLVIQAESNGICYHTLYSRLQMGIPADQAATKPVVTAKDHPWRKAETDRINLIMQKQC